MASFDNNLVRVNDNLEVTGAITTNSVIVNTFRSKPDRKNLWYHNNR